MKKDIKAKSKEIILMTLLNRCGGQKPIQINDREIFSYRKPWILSLVLNSLHQTLSAVVLVLFYTITLCLPEKVSIPKRAANQKAFANFCENVHLMSLNTSKIFRTLFLPNITFPVWELIWTGNKLSLSQAHWMK